jgi:hypothetical protein
MNAGDTLERKSWGMPLLFLFLCYPLAIAGPLSYAIFPLLLWALNRSLKERNRVLTAILLLTNPLSLIAMKAAADYARGAPSLRSMGLPDAEFSNIDRKTRCFRTTGGCLVNGDEWVVEAPHNLTLHLLCSILGPPSKSYDGPYPDKETALRIVSAAPLQKAEDLSESRISFGSESFQFTPENAEALASGLGTYGAFGPDYDSELFRIQAASFEQRCLIIRVRETEIFDPEGTDCLVLIDQTTLRPFCRYQISGDRMPRFARFQYLPEHSR